jgi:hypothetical protein
LKIDFLSFGSDSSFCSRAVTNFDEKLRKLIKRAKKQRGMLWPSVISNLELATPMFVQ